MSQTFADDGFVIHSRRYRENSRIVEIFTREHGRIALVARVSAKRGGREMAALQAYRECLFNWRGKNDLQNLVSVDARENYSLQGERGICGLYCNELILYLLDKQLPFPDLYAGYKKTIQQLNSDTNPAVSLRKFEGTLLDQLGFGLDLGIADDQETSQRICYFHPENGLSFEYEKNSIEVKPEVLNDLCRQDYSAAATGRIAKVIFGSTIHNLLEGKKLRSRELMQSYRKYKTSDDNES